MHTATAPEPQLARSPQPTTEPKQWAIVCTADSFPLLPMKHPSVALCHSEDDAYGHAATILINNGHAAWYGEAYIMDDMHFPTSRSLLEHFQYQLNPTEYFHVMPVL